MGVSSSDTQMPVFSITKNSIGFFVGSDVGMGVGRLVGGLIGWRVGYVEMHKEEMKRVRCRK